MLLAATGGSAVFTVSPSFEGVSVTGGSAWTGVSFCGWEGAKWFRKNDQLNMQTILNERMKAINK